MIVRLRSWDGAVPPANIDVSRVCSDDGSILPKKVCITFTSDDVLWKAVRDFDAAANTYTVVDSELTIVDENVQTVFLSSPQGIAQVRIVGSGVCISSVCWECQPTITVTSSGEERLLQMTKAAWCGSRPAFIPTTVLPLSFSAAP